MSFGTEWKYQFERFIKLVAEQVSLGWQLCTIGPVNVQTVLAYPRYYRIMSYLFRWVRTSTWIDPRVDQAAKRRYDMQNYTTNPQKCLIK